MRGLPSYLSIPAEELGRGQPVRVRINGDSAALDRDFAEAILTEIIAGEAGGSGATLILPVGPIDQFSILARLINERKLSCRKAVFINMDEYLDENDQWISLDHPLSFRAFMNRAFYDLLDAELSAPPANRIFPDPRDPSFIQRLIDSRGGVDCCFGGIGINGHLAFNEPPDPGEEMSVERFAVLPTRTLSLSRETRTINSVTVGGEMGIVPKRAITIGMKEILGARRLRFYCNRPWQGSVVRRALHGPITAACPASLLRRHSDASVTLADFVASRPEIKLR